MADEPSRTVALRLEGPDVLEKHGGKMSLFSRGNPTRPEQLAAPELVPKWI